MITKKATLSNLLYTAILYSLLLASLAANTQPVTLPRLSPRASVSQTIGISTVAVSYSRPCVKQRKIWGEVVPYGWNVQSGMGNSNPAPWRAGADENTTIRFSHNVKVEGTTVPAGIYGLFFTINEDNSGELILSKNYTSWGSFFYTPEEDLLRVKITTRDNIFTEFLTFDFINITKNTAELVLNWEKKQFPVKLSFAVNELVMANAAEELCGTTGFGAEGYISAAYYSFQNNINTTQGKIWIDKALEIEPTNYQAIWVKSRFLVRDGKSEEAEKLIKNALESASETEIAGFGNMFLNLGITDRAIKIFQKYTDRYPKSANAWFSLGEGYSKKGDRVNAINSYKKAMTFNPETKLKKNIESKLKEFGVF